MSDKKVHEVTLHASAAETVDGNSVDLGFPPKDAVFTLDITAVAGTTPTLDVTIEELDPLSGKYSVIDTFAQQISAVKVRRTLAGPFGNAIRAVWVISTSGGDSFTFSLGAQGKSDF